MQSINSPTSKSTFIFHFFLFFSQNLCVKMVAWFKDNENTLLLEQDKKYMKETKTKYNDRLKTDAANQCLSKRLQIVRMQDINKQASQQQYNY